MRRICFVEPEGGGELSGLNFLHVWGLSVAFGRFFCLFNRHRPRRSVEWDGSHYRSDCRRCSRPITRLARHKWRIERQSKGGDTG